MAGLVSPSTVCLLVTREPLPAGLSTLCHFSKPPKLRLPEILPPVPQPEECFPRTSPSAACPSKKRCSPGWSPALPGYCLPKALLRLGDQTLGSSVNPPGVPGDSRCSPGFAPRRMIATARECRELPWGAACFRTHAALGAERRKTLLRLGDLKKFQKISKCSFSGGIHSWALPRSPPPQNTWNFGNFWGENDKVPHSVTGVMWVNFSHKNSHNEVYLSWSRAPVLRRSLFSLKNSINSKNRIN